MIKSIRLDLKHIKQIQTKLSYSYGEEGSMETIREKIIEKIERCDDETKLKMIYQFIIGVLGC